MSSSCHPRALARAGAALPLLAALAAGAPAAAAVDDAPTGSSGWVRPVAGAQVAPFLAPPAPFAAGHRGADLAAPPGTPVLAAGAGTVAFAGPVAGAVHVVVDHGDGVATGYSFLRDASVREGAHVAPGDLLGHSGGRPGAGDDRHDGGVVHVSLVVDGEYRDPMVLFRGVDLVASVRLVPEAAQRAQAADPHDALVDAEYDLQRDDRLPSWLRNEAWIAEQRRARRSLFEQVRDAAGAGAGWLARQGRRGLEHLAGFEDRVLPFSPTGLALDLYDAARTQGPCASEPVSAASPVNQHEALFVAGLDSQGTGGPTSDFPLEQMYAQGRAHWFEYPSAAQPGYAQADTHGSLLEAAAALRDQLAALRAGGTLEVDLVAHSQGGLVVAAFLQHFYDDDLDELPLVSRVATIASPLEGAPLAAVASGPLGVAAEALTGRDVASDATRDLAPGSAFLGSLDGFRVPDGVEFLSIGVPTDLVVPATVTDDLPGTRAVPETVTGGWSAHSAATADPGVHETVRTFMAGEGVMCASRLERIAGVLSGTAIRAVERLPAPRLP